MKINKETINKIEKTVEVAIAPAIVGTAAIWGFEIAVYVGAFTSAVIAILECVKLFCKK